jgi:hypothetical protein
MVEIMVGHRDGQAVLVRLLWQPLGQRPGPEHPIFLEAEVEMVSWPMVLVQHEAWPRGRVVGG